MRLTIDQALDLLRPHIVTIAPPITIREILEELHDSAQDELLADLVDTATAAAVWGVSKRRARAYLATLNATRGIGFKLGDSWVIRRSHLERFAPNKRMRRVKRQTEGTHE